MELYIPTPDTKLAAALSTLGFPVKLRDVLDDVTGSEQLTWQITPKSVSLPALKLHNLIKHLRDGTLEKEDPQHPLLDGIAVIRNRERILDLLKQGRPITLAVCAGNVRTCYVHHPLVDPPVSFGRFKTTDFRLVCALGRLGIPLVSFTGSHGSYEFTTTSKAVVAGMHYDATALDLARKRETLSPEHPLLYCIKTLENHSRLLNVISASRHTVMIRKPGSKKAAWIHEDASNDAYDRVRKHLRI